MPLKISTLSAIAACDALVGAINTGASNPTMVVYDGTPPANVDDGLSGNNALVTFTLPTPAAFGPAADNTDRVTSEVDPQEVPQVNASADGTATFFRVFDGDGVAIVQGVASEVGGGGDLELSSTSIVTGVDVILVSASISLPKG